MRDDIERLQWAAGGLQSAMRCDLLVLRGAGAPTGALQLLQGAERIRRLDTFKMLDIDKQCLPDNAAQRGFESLMVCNPSVDPGKGQARFEVQLYCAGGNGTAEEIRGAPRGRHEGLVLIHS